MRLTIKAKFYGFGDSFYNFCIIFTASLDSLQTIGHWVLWPFVCSLYVYKQLAIELLIYTGFLWQGRWVFEFQNLDDSFSGRYMKLYKELLNFLAVISQKYSRIHIIIIENFKNSVPSIFFFDRSNLEKECHTNHGMDINSKIKNFKNMVPIIFYFILFL